MQTRMQALHNQCASRLRTCIRTMCYGYQQLMHHEESSEDEPRSREWRTVYINDPARTLHLPNNAIRSTKYTVFTFLPMNLYEQFRHYMNRYFLLIAFLQLWRTITPVNPITTWAPLILVLAVTAVREAYDDYRRHQADKQANSRICEILDCGVITNVRAEDIRPGHLVVVRNNQQVPCDLAALKSRITQTDKSGVLYVQTAMLDGETDLKPRQSLHSTNEASDEELSGLRCRVKCDPPNARVHQFNAILHWDRDGVSSKFPNEWPVRNTSLEESNTIQTTEPLDAENLVQQGTVLKDTEYIVGVAVYTGGETKLGKNTSLPPTKIGLVDNRINWITASIFCAQLVMIVICGSVGNAHNLPPSLRKVWYISQESEISKNHWYSSLIIPLRFLLLNSMMIPISLRVTLDVAKTYYAFLISHDLKMYDEQLDVAASANNTDIVEDLGHIGSVLTDKTGTLTDNVMNFKMASIFGNMISSKEAWSVEQSEKNFDVRFSEALNQQDHYNTKDLYWLTLALCNTVKPQKVYGLSSQDMAYFGCGPGRRASTSSSISSGSIDDIFEGEIDTSKSYICLEFQSASPDEEALVYAASRAGISLINRTRIDDEKEEITLRPQVSIPELSLSHLSDLEFDPAAKRVWIPEDANSACDSNVSDRTITILHTMPFTSKRKRMSVVVRFQETSQIFVLTKGADEILFPRLGRCSNQSAEADLRRTTSSHVENFAKSGLRALMIVVRRMKQNEYDLWLQEWNQARRSMENREEAMDTVADKLEREFELLGATAVEDALQKGVPSTLQKLRLGGCRVWMLTGDKYTTAIQIALSSKLMDRPDTTLMKGERNRRRSIDDATLEQSSEANADNAFSLDKQVVLMSIRGNSKRDVARELQYIQRKLTVMKNNHEQLECTLVLDGCALPYMLEEFSEELLQLASSSKSLICCRASPSQKAELTRVARKLGQRTLAIGDGGNDCPMILAADVGVGIAGREGMQAARSADFTFARFRFLERLILVHGRLAHYRTAFIAQYCFYKSLILCLLQILYNTQCMMSGCSLLDTFSLTTYNMIYTAGPVLFFVLDRDRQLSSLSKFPELYSESLSDKWITLRTFCWWAVRAVYQAILVFLVTIMATRTAGGGDDEVTGDTPDSVVLSYTAFTALLFIVYATLVVESSSPVWINHAINAMCLLAYPVLLTLRGVILGGDANIGMLYSILSNPASFYALLLVLIVSVYPAWVHRQAQFNRRLEVERKMWLQMPREIDEVMTSDDYLPYPAEVA